MARAARAEAALAAATSEASALRDALEESGRAARAAAREASGKLATAERCVLMPFVPVPEMERNF